MNQDGMNSFKNTNKIYGVIIAILVVIILGGTCYFLYDKGILFNSKETKEESSKENLQGQKEEVPKEENPIEEIKPLDLSKPLNTTGLTYSNPIETVSFNCGLSMEIGVDKKSAILHIDWNQFGKFSSSSAWSQEVIDYNITGFTKEIESVFVGEVGQSAQGLFLFYQMSDGTVEYTPMFRRVATQQITLNYVLEKDNTGNITGEHFETSGAIQGVQDVIKLYNADANATIGGSRTTIASKKDGSFYDLGQIVAS